MNRYRTVLIGLSFVCGCLVCELTFAQDDPQVTNNPTPAVTIADLEQALKSGLRARRPIEFEFIRTVIAKVKTNELPLDLVQGTYLWARKKKPYPYPYFERALRERAAKQGINLPPGLGTVSD